MYEIKITPEGLRHLSKLPTKVGDAAIAALLGPISENPHRLAKRLVGKLEGLRSARRGDYRIIYEIDDSSLIVTVHRVQHRATAYRPR